MSGWLDRQRRALVQAWWRAIAATGCARPGVAGCRRRACCAARCSSSNANSVTRTVFHLEDSASFRAFARVPLAWSPKRSVLHRTISAIRPQTWEAVNRALVASAKQDKLETGASPRPWRACRPPPRFGCRAGLSGLPLARLSRRPLSISTPRPHAPPGRRRAAPGPGVEPQPFTQRQGLRRAPQPPPAADGTGVRVRATPRPLPEGGEAANGALRAPEAVGKRCGKSPS